MVAPADASSAVISLISDGLYLGAVQPSTSEAMLTERNIKSIVCCASELRPAFPKASPIYAEP